MKGPRLNTAPIQLLSIVIPCRNEEKHIINCLDSILSGTYPLERLEIILVDGQSTDKTRDIIKGYAAHYPFIRLIDNPGKIVPTGMNIGIHAAKGEIIVRLDTHSAYPRDYLVRCIELLLESGAGNAGGRVVNVPNGNGLWAVPVSFVTAHRFGVGNGAFRTSDKPGFVDTVPFGIFKRKVFDAVGYYDERLTRNQDNELNARLRKHGFKIAFDPAIRISYKNQATLAGLVHQAFYTGMWNVYTLTLHPYTFKWRRFIPAVFVAYLLSIPFGLVLTVWGRVYSIPAVLYVLINLVISLTRQYGLPVKVRIALTFLSYHLAYGSGTLFGIVNILTGRWHNYLGQPLRK